MKIQTFVLGDYQTNSFCLTATEDTKDCVIIDAGLSPEPLVDHLKENELNPVVVVLTHGHTDHIFGVNALCENFGDIKIAIHKDDFAMLSDPVQNLSLMGGFSFTTKPADIILKDRSTVEFAQIKLQVLHTPGHTPGGISLYSESDGVVFSGDALFASSIGRTDFVGGDYNQLINAIKTKLLVLPDETLVLTGHGPETTIGQEKKINQFLR